MVGGRIGCVAYRLAPIPPGGHCCWRRGLPARPVGAPTCFDVVGERPGPGISRGAENNDVRRLFRFLASICVIEGRGRAALAGMTWGIVLIAILAMGARPVSRSLDRRAFDRQRVRGIFAGPLAWPVGYWNGLGAILTFGILTLLWFGTRSELRSVRALAEVRFRS